MISILSLPLAVLSCMSFVAPASAQSNGDTYWYDYLNTYGFTDVSPTTNPPRVPAATPAPVAAPLVTAIQTIAQPAPVKANTRVAPTSACYGDASWPVGIIYLHGLFGATGTGDPSGFRQLEYNNREDLQKLAYQLHVRIAAPVSPVISGADRAWNGVTLSKIESLASSACNGSALAPKRSLIGFSNGAFQVKDMVCDTKDNFSAYTSLVAIGMQEAAPSSCAHKFTNIEPHVFPPASPSKNVSSLQYLANLSGQEPVQVAQTPAGDVGTTQ
jgi:hypothetical protein